MPQNKSFAIRCADAQDDRNCWRKGIDVSFRCCVQITAVFTKHLILLIFSNPINTCHPEPRSERRIQSALRSADSGCHCNATRGDQTRLRPLTRCLHMPQNRSFAIRCADAQDDSIGRLKKKVCDFDRILTKYAQQRSLCKQLILQTFHCPTPACHPEPRSERRIQFAIKSADSGCNSKAERGNQVSLRQLIGSPLPCYWP